MNHLESPTVSVIIPTRNRSEVLADTLRGLEQQTLDPSRYEVFIMDNLSTDDTEEVVRAFAARAPFTVHYHRMERNEGPTPGRNLGAQMARSRILAFTDSDCRPCPNWLECGVAAFTDGVGLVSGPVIYKPEQQGTFFARRTNETKVEHPTYPTANAWYLRDVFLDHGGFDASLCFRDPFDRAVECADSDLAWRIIKSGHRKVFVPDLIIYHELETQTPLAWLLEPTRLFPLPKLVELHPELRDHLLIGRLFFYRGSIFYYAALLCAIVVAVVDWRWLLLGPVLIIARAVLRAPRPTPSAWLKSCGEVMLNVTRNYLLCLTLVYGSIRYRTLVL